MEIGPRIAPVSPLFRHDAPIGEDPIRLLLDRRVPWMTHEETFSQQSFGTGPWPDQGWKLHVSATPLSAPDVLDAALDVLLAVGARFKVVGSISLLSAMNSGVFGTPQIGKFITVYPSDDDEAVRLAVELDQVTRGRRGPRVPTDRPLRPDSLVHYRYGSMRRRPESEMTGQSDGAYDLLDPAGRLTDDVRLDFYRPPHQAVLDPFEAAGVRVSPPARGRFLNRRYLVTDALAQSTRGGVFRAIDVSAQPARLCLVKEAWHDVALDTFGRDARDWAANEEHILTRYAGDPVLPRFYDRFDVDGDRYIVIEYVEGTSLDKILSEEYSVERGIDTSDVMAVGLATADVLSRLHDLGLVFRDFKPANLVKTPDGGYRLIDFGIVYEYRVDTGPPLSIGTPPFYPREQYEGEAPSPADDVFAWGAVLYYLAGGNESLADMPKEKDVLQPFRRRPLAEVCRTVPSELAAVIDRAVAWDRADRYSTMREAREALAEAADRLDASRQGAQHPAAGRADVATASASAEGMGPEEALRLAREVGDALCVEAEEQGGGLRWKRCFEWSERTEYGPDLYGGTAGVGLFLAELAHLTGEERYASAARGAARWLGGPTWGRGRAVHGFHSGEAGVACFFLRLSVLLDAPGYVAAAAMRLRRLRGASCHTIDLLYGTAGTLLGYLSLHAATGDRGFLDDARTAGDQLVATALAAPKGAQGCYWEIASAAPGGPVVPYLGLLHGAAGIGLAIAHLARVTGEERYFDTARRAADLLLAQAVPAPSDIPSRGGAGGALRWPRHVGDTKPGLQAQCHGAGGIGQFFLLLNRLRPEPRYRQAAEGAAAAVVAQRVSETRSGICHGLSGTGHFTLDCYQALGDPQWLAYARECAGRLRRFQLPERPGVYSMHGEKAASPDLMLGYAGVGSFLLRLVNPAHTPDLILGHLNDSH